MPDDVLPVPPGGSAAQQEYDRQVVESVKAGDEAGLARLKGFAGGLGIGAARDTENLASVTFAFTPPTEPATLYFGDGTSADLAAGEQSAVHEYPGAGFWAAVLVSGGQHGVCVVETDEAPVIPRGKSRKGK